MLHINALQITETVAPTVEPITTAEAKTHLRVDGSDDDTFIDGLIESARQSVEADTGRAMVERTYRADVRHWSDCIVLPRPPLVSVSSIKYYDADNAQQTLAASNYEVDAAGGRIVEAKDATIPTYYDRFDAWQITFVAGYAAATSPEDYRAPIPEALKAAMKLIIGDLYENRERTAPIRIQELRAVDRLLAHYRAR